MSALGWGSTGEGGCAWQLAKKTGLATDGLKCDQGHYAQVKHQVLWGQERTSSVPFFIFVNFFFQKVFLVATDDYGLD